jgi:pimeloyl-ACP methyl ester carboxylesterase
MSTFDFHSADGTRVVGWRNDAEGAVPVVISNGLGTPPSAWPTITAPDSGFDVATWYYRGTGGGDRPADPSHIGVDDHVADMLALMDHLGIERALVACWSIGVNVGFQFAEHYPDRVAGILGVAGVPGGTFEAMGGPLPLPRRLRRRAGRSAAGLLAACGPALTKLANTVPMTPTTARVITSTGFVGKAARPHIVATLEEFKTHDFRYYFRLAQAAEAHDPMDLSFVQCPVTLVAGRRDMITTVKAMVRAAEQIPHARVRTVAGTHFLPLERPDELHQLLVELADHTGMSDLWTENSKIRP